MKLFYLITFFLFTSLFLVKSFGQDSIRKIHICYTNSLGSWSRFYDSDIKFSTKIDKSLTNTFMSDLVIKIPILKKSEINLNFNYMQKTNETKNHIPYYLDYISYAPIYGRELYRNFNNHFVGIGPYIAYLLGAKKGDELIDDIELKHWDFGLEFMLNFYDDRLDYNSVFINFYVLKFQFGLRDVFGFKTMSGTISFFGFIY